MSKKEKVEKSEEVVLETTVEETPEVNLEEQLKEANNKYMLIYADF